MTYEEAARIIGTLDWDAPAASEAAVRCALDMAYAALREKHDAEQAAALANPQNPEGWYPGRVGRG